MSINQTYRFIAQRIANPTLQKNVGLGFSALVSRMAVVSVAITIVVILLSFAVLLGFKNAIKSKIFSFSGHIRIVKTSNNQSLEEPPVAIQTDFFKQKDKIPFIQHVQLYAQKPGVIKVKENVQGVVLKGVGEDYRKEDFLENLQEGRWLNYNKNGESKETLISRTIARKLNLKLGDSIIVIFVQEPPRFRKLAVVGIYETGVGIFDEKFLITDIKTIQKVNNWGDSLVSGYEIFLKDFDKLVENSRELENFLPYDLSQQPITAKHFDTFEWLELLDNNVVIILVIILAVTAFNIISVLLIMMMERTNMIGILKAIGAENKQIERIFFFQAGYIVLRGFLWGNVVAYLLYLVEYYGKLIPLDTQNYLVSYVPVQWNWLVWILANLGTFLLISLVMWLPIRFVVKVPPVKAIRFV